MKPIISAALLYAIVTTGIMLANVFGFTAWAVMGALYLAVVLAFEIHVAGNASSLWHCAQFNAIVAAIVSVLVFIDITTVHRGIVKDATAGTKLMFAIGWVGIPTGIAGILSCGLAKAILDRRARQE